MSWDSREWESRDREVPPDASIILPRLNNDYTLWMESYLHNRSLSYALARQYGWYPGWYKGPRIVVPCVRTDYKNFFQARLLDNVAEPEMITKEWKRWESPFGPRGDALCHLAVPGASAVVIVEGPMDALAAAMTGASAIALLGVGAPGPVIAHVAVLSQRYPKVLLIPDKDEVGKWAKIQRLLGEMGTVSEIRIPYAKDLADMVPARRTELIYGAS